MFILFYEKEEFLFSKNTNIILYSSMNLKIANLTRKKKIFDVQKKESLLRLVSHQN